MFANVVHLYTYHVHLLNPFPFIPVLVLGVLAFLCIIMGIDEPGSVIVGMVFGAIALALGLCFPWNSSELRHGAEIQVQVNHQTVWIPAQKLPNGVYWPVGDRVSAHKHPDSDRTK